MDEVSWRGLQYSDARPSDSGIVGSSHYDARITLRPRAEDLTMDWSTLLRMPMTVLLVLAAVFLLITLVQLVVLRQHLHGRAKACRDVASAALPGVFCAGVADGRVPATRCAAIACSAKRRRWSTLKRTSCRRSAGR